MQSTLKNLAALSVEMHIRTDGPTWVGGDVGSVIIYFTQHQEGWMHEQMYHLEDERVYHME